MHKWQNSIMNKIGGKILYKEQEIIEQYHE